MAASPSRRPPPPLRCSPGPRTPPLSAWNTGSLSPPRMELGSPAARPLDCFNLLPLLHRLNGESSPLPTLQWGLKDREWEGKTATPALLIRPPSSAACPQHLPTLFLSHPALELWAQAGAGEHTLTHTHTHTRTRCKARTPPGQGCTRRAPEIYTACPR